MVIKKNVLSCHKKNNHNAKKENRHIRLMFFNCLHFFPRKFKQIFLTNSHYSSAKKTIGIYYLNCIYVFADFKPGQITVMMKNIPNCHGNVTMQNRLNFIS